MAQEQIFQLFKKYRRGINMSPRQICDLYKQIYGECPKRSNIYRNLKKLKHNKFLKSEKIYDLKLNRYITYYWR